MINGLIGKKLGMTQVFDGEGRTIPVTVVEAGPCTVVEVRTKDRHGYDAVQVAFEEIPERKLTKPQLGHLKKAQVKPSRVLREFRKQGDAQVGQVLRADLFQKGEWVDVIGTSIGKGFQGVIKRHHFSGGPETHGHMFHRQPGSIGSSAYPSHVWKNKRLAGHMGAERVTTKGLRIVETRPDENLLFISGSVPGPPGGIVLVRKAK